jgi:hypothetical protein
MVTVPRADGRRLSVSPDHQGAAGSLANLPTRDGYVVNVQTRSWRADRAAGVPGGAAIMNAWS